MLTGMNLSKENRMLDYERFQYYSEKVQKKLYALCLKVAYGYTNTETGRILDIHSNSEKPQTVKN
jgi:hypothetical protein